MAEIPADVLVAGYPDIGGASKDFGSLGASSGTRRSRSTA